MRARYTLAGLIVAGLAGFLLLTQPQRRDTTALSGLSGDPARGETVFWAAGCATCHMAPGAQGADQLVLAGGQAFASPFGAFLAPNISTDPVLGIGGWSLVDFAVAIQSGVSPDGRHYFPVLPYAAFNKMLPQDVVDLKSYLDTLPAAATPNQPHQVGFPFNIRRNLGIWKRLFLTDTWQMADPLSNQQARGRYIVEALAHCAECHTPRNLLGGLKRARWLAGAPMPDGKTKAPNLTPAKLHWTEAEIVTYLTTGFTPEFDSAGGHMALVAANMARLPETDRWAIAAYLKALPAIE